MNNSFLCPMLVPRTFLIGVGAMQSGFAESICAFKDDIVQATIDVYNTSMTSLLPTPTKSHYLFNLRDVSRVIGGIVMMKRSAIADAKGAKVKYVRLWAHEILRVFYDRCEAAIIAMHICILQTYLHFALQSQLCCILKVS
jgi:AAA+ lid domain